MNSLADLWQEMKKNMAKMLSDTTINTWFDEVSIVALEDMALVLHCGNEFKRKVIVSRFIPYIMEAAYDTFSERIAVKMLDDDQLAAYHGVRPDHPEGDDNEKAFTFQTFVAGPQNKLAYAAALSVSEYPACGYNPLFIYGDSGLGKTHLLYAIRHETLRLHPNFNIAYVKGDEFINEFIELVRAGKGDEFRSKYRVADMLLVDDIQFVSGKEQVQNEFFHTFNTLYEAGKQIVMTSDRPPREMALLDDRLRTRFEWGLMADITPPDYETRLAIVRNKVKMLRLPLEDESMDSIAENITSNVRKIEGFLSKLLAYYDLMGDRLDKDTVQMLLKEYLEKNNDYMTPSNILQCVASYFSLDVETITGQERRKDVANARNIAIYLIRRMVSSMTLKEIGKVFDGRDHSTVLSSLKRVETLMRTDPAFADTVKQITTNINAKA